jgi:hypothetical protein
LGCAEVAAQLVRPNSGFLTRPTLGSEKPLISSGKERLTGSRSAKMHCVSEDWTQRLAAALTSSMRECAGRLRGQGGRVVRNRLPSMERLLGARRPGGDRRVEALQFRGSPNIVGPDGRTWAGDAEVYAAASDRKAVADAFLTACALAVGRAEPTEAIQLLNRDPRFRISVAHPDDGREFYPPPS